MGNFSRYLKILNESFESFYIQTRDGNKVLFPIYKNPSFSEIEHIIENDKEVLPQCYGVRFSITKDKVIYAHSSEIFHNSVEKFLGIKIELKLIYDYKTGELTEDFEDRDPNKEHKLFSEIKDHLIDILPKNAHYK